MTTPTEASAGPPPVPPAPEPRIDPAKGRRRRSWLIVGTALAMLAIGCLVLVWLFDPAPAPDSGNEPSLHQEAQQRTTTELAEARAGADGSLPLDVALDLFASAYGPVPGGSPRFDALRPGDGTLALRAIGAHADDLSDAQLAAIEAELADLGPAPRDTDDETGSAPTGSIGSTGEGELALAAPAGPTSSSSQDDDESAEQALPASADQTPGTDPTSGDDVVRDEADDRAQAEAEATADELASHFGRPLMATLDVHVVPASVFDGRDVLGDAVPTRRGRSTFRATHDGCRIRISDGADDTSVTVAHEVVHCFQFEMGNLATVYNAPDWIAEGSAEWAAAALGRSDPTLRFHYSAWQSADFGLFDMDYGAVGYFWTVESMGADPWALMPLMLSTDGSAAVGVSGLDPSAVASRMATGTARRSVDRLDVDEAWDLSPAAVPRSRYRQRQPASPGHPANVVAVDQAAFSRLPVQDVRVTGGLPVDIEIEAGAGAVQTVGGRVQTFVGPTTIRACPPDEDDDGPYHVLVGLARVDPGPLSLLVTPVDEPCEDGVVGSWVVVEPADSAEDFGESVLEIEEGPSPALYTGIPTWPHTDCPIWGDLTLDEEISVSAGGLVPPDETRVTDAWRGTMTFWCLDAEDTTVPVVFGLLDDGRLVVRFEGGDGLPLVLGPAPDQPADPGPIFHG